MPENRNMVKWIEFLITAMTDPFISFYHFWQMNVTPKIHSIGLIRTDKVL